MTSLKQNKKEVNPTIASLEGFVVLPERPPRYKNASFLFNKRTGKGWLLCEHCKCKLKNQDEMTSLERMSMIGLSSIRFHLCDKCRPILSKKFVEYLNAVRKAWRVFFKYKAEQKAARNERKNQQTIE